MHHQSDYLLQLNKLSQDAVEQLRPSFSNLPGTEHADGNYRLRRYSVVRMHDDMIEKLPAREFMQGSDINKFQGNVARSFEDLEQEVINSEGFREMCRLFSQANELDEETDIEIHQIRIAANQRAAEVAPEGVHQDGFDHIAIVSIERDNIEGGNFQVYKQKDQAPILSIPLDCGEVAMLDDSELWHYAQPIRPKNPGKPGNMDVFVLTAKGNL